jgi:hypothetical protein
VARSEARRNSDVHPSPAHDEVVGAPDFCSKGRACVNIYRNVPAQTVGKTESILADLSQSSGVAFAVTVLLVSVSVRETSALWMFGVQNELTAEDNGVSVAQF